MSSAQDTATEVAAFLRILPRATVPEKKVEKNKNQKEKWQVENPVMRGA